jgi:hypothetical protein
LTVANLVVEPLGERELAYIRTKEFADDDILARLGLHLDTEPQDGGASHELGLNISHPSGPSTSDPPFPLCVVTDETSAGFNSITYMAGLDVPLPASAGWEDPQPSLPGIGVTDMTFIVPSTTQWPSWSNIDGNEGLNEQTSATTELNALSPSILVPALSQRLLPGTQEYPFDSDPTSLHPQQPGRPRARTAPTVFRDNTLDTPLSYPLGSPISVPPSTPHSLYSGECGSSSSSPFSLSHDLPSYGIHSGSDFDSRLRSYSVSRGRPLTRRRMGNPALAPGRVWPYPSDRTDFSQGITPGSISPALKHLDVLVFDRRRAGSDAPDYALDDYSTPSTLSRASSTSSVHRRPRSHSRSSTPYPKLSSGVAAVDGIACNPGAGTNSPEHLKPSKKGKCNRRDEFPGQRLHFDKTFTETVLGDNLSLRVLLDNILGSPWRKDHTLEPNYGAKNDDVSQGLSLPIERGSSVLLAFIRKVDDEHTCILCKGLVSTRVPRQLGHVRGHLDLRPFSCAGCDSCDPKCVFTGLLAVISILTYP